MSKLFALLPAALLTLGLGVSTAQDCGGCPEAAKAKAAKKADCGGEKAFEKSAINLDGDCEPAGCDKTKTAKVADCEPAGCDKAKTAKVADCDPATCDDGAKVAKTKKAMDCGGCEGEAKVAKTKKAMDCGGCEGGAKVAKKADCDPGHCGMGKTAKLNKKGKALTVSAKFAKAQAGAKKGCEKSAAKLAKLKALCEGEAECDKSMTKAITDLETWSAKGCKDSKAKLAKMDKILSGEKKALSARFAKLNVSANKGCKTSAAKLVAFKKAAGTECSDTLAKRIVKLETAAAKGCATSKKQLATLEASLESKKVQATTKKASVKRTKTRSGKTIF